MHNKENEKTREKKHEKLDEMTFKWIEEHKLKYYTQNNFPNNSFEKVYMRLFSECFIFRYLFFLFSFIYLFSRFL